MSRILFALFTFATVCLLVMSQNTYKPKNTIRETQAENGSSGKKPAAPVDSMRKIAFALGIVSISLAIFLIIALISYPISWSADQSMVEAMKSDGQTSPQNWAGFMGAIASYWLIGKGLGLSMLLLPVWLLNAGYRLIFSRNLLNIPLINTRIFSIILFSALFFGNLSASFSESLQSESMPGSFLDLLCGSIGFEMALFLNAMLGWGSWIFIFSAGILLAVFVFRYDPDSFTGKEEKTNRLGKKKKKEELLPDESEETEPDTDFSEEEASTHPEYGENETDQIETETAEIPSSEKPEVISLSQSDGLQIEVGAGKGDKEISDTSVLEENLSAEQLQDKFGLFDPTLELSGYKFPPLDLLQHHGTQDLEINTDEIEYNKDRIIETLRHYNITIASIKATVGPTVTLFEIVPDAGIRISKIKSLEDDIAMSLEALGIRIIAPIPGKGTIGIEVPTKNRLMVSTRSVMATEKFVKSDLDLPIVLGKTISNEVYIADLAKMPHLLVAGATGQGKSVGINVLLTSLLYKKHPSQLKLVLVDPKKVEMSLYSKLERHFLAALPDADECIITDTKKVVNTLNSLCIEMDTRYSLLKDAGCRNIKEYNQKFRERRLNPENGHRFLPFIVLVIDELADLMMTAGKEVETPIARLAQLARAIGIHLIVATQRPSVNVITGVIKANFPARLSFRVSSKIDSRTILDQGGADQLVPGGDMLLSMGSDVIRIQCPFISTAEVESICDYIGNQRGYEMAYLLPEAPGDETGSSAEFDPSELDPLLEEAARLIVAHQQGSTSLIQRKMKLGYNRAGRLIDQMESLGIVGPFEGSKARQVLVDEYRLEQILRDLER
jgi:S-DNA-T family DNA segregation ATPase FtsK/SpoIIIE